MPIQSVSIRGLWAWSLTILFIYLKLTDEIDWNWILVLSPAIIRTVAIQSYAFYAVARSRKHVNVEEQKPVHPTGFYA